MTTATTPSIGYQPFLAGAQADPARMAIRIGVMGGASDITLQELMEKAHTLGRAVARAGCVLVTGACPGLPLAAACGAKQVGGLVVGISPAMSLEEHTGKYASPTAFHDILIYTGNGLMGREVINIRSSDVVLFVGGRSGTLGELAIAYEEGKLIGVLTGTGGISSMVADILAACAKDTGSEVIYETDPERLVAELLQRYPALPGSIGKGGEGGVKNETVEDLVCRMRILPSAVTAERVWNGVRYSFCSRTCAALFDTDPGRFIVQALEKR